MKLKQKGTTFLKGRDGKRLIWLIVILLGLRWAIASGVESGVKSLSYRIHLLSQAVQHSSMLK
ncbi:hypothetical protein ACFL96_15745 [Thermoproteota archaeon]